MQASVQGVPHLARLVHHIETSLFYEAPNRYKFPAGVMLVGNLILSSISVDELDSPKATGILKWDDIWAPKEEEFIALFDPAKSADVLYKD